MLLMPSSSWSMFGRDMLVWWGSPQNSNFFHSFSTPGLTLVSFVFVLAHFTLIALASGYSDGASGSGFAGAEAVPLHTRLLNQRPLVFNTKPSSIPLAIRAQLCLLALAKHCKHCRLNHSLTWQQLLCIMDSPLVFQNQFSNTRLCMIMPCCIYLP